MLRRAPIFLLALLVFAANTICACLTPAVEQARVATNAHHHASCHAKKPTREPCHESNRQSCPHCSGLTSAIGSSAKTTTPALAPISAMLAILPNEPSLGAMTLPHGLVAHPGLSPPTAPTLLNLACALNT